MNIKKTKNAKITSSKKDILSDSDFLPQNIGHRISIVIPEDVLMSSRKLAAERGIGYQTLINQILRKELLGNSANTTLEERIKKLEKAILRKSAA